MPKAKPVWLGPNFESEQKRNAAVKELTKKAIDQAVSEQRVGTVVAGAAPSLAAQLTASLNDREGPRASAAAELAFMLCAYCLAEGRVLKLLPPSDDLTSSNRLAGDRTVSEHVSAVLKSYNIPATEGSMQSSTYRGGYLAAQSADVGVRAFLVWLGSASLGDIKEMFWGLARAFAAHELAFAELPALDTGRFSFVAMRQLIERLRSKGSGGAYEQYLVAALLHEEFALVHPTWRVQTKSVGAADTSARATGDVEVRHRQALVHAIEVSASQWQHKLAQAAQTSRRTRTNQVTVLAPASDLSADALAGALAAAGVPAGVDVAVVDLGSFLDAVSSRLPALGRASAVRRLHQDLVTWGRTRPDLVSFLVESLTDLGLAAPVPTPASFGGVAEPVARLRNLAEQSVGDVVVEVSREDLDTVLVWVEEHLGQDG